MLRKPYVVPLLFILACGVAETVHAQKLLETADTLTGRVDTLKIPNLTVPKLTLKDSLTSVELGKMESSANKMQHKVDSLQKLKLPTEKYSHKLDSISARLQSRIRYQNKLDSMSHKLTGRTQGVINKRDSLQMRVNDRAKSLQKSMSKRSSVLDSASLRFSDPITGKSFDNNTGSVKSALTQVVPGQTKLPGNVPNIPGGNPGLKTDPLKGSALNTNASVPKIDGLNTGELKNVSNQINQAQNFPQNSINGNETFKEVKTETQKISNSTKELKAYQKDLSKMRKGNLDSLSTVQNSAEKILRQNDGVKELTKETGELTKSKNMLEQYHAMASSMNEKSLKDQLKNVNKNPLTDPFKGQEAKLQAGIAQLDKLKRKYHEIPDSRYLPKRVPNFYKGKPFRERIIPAFAFQLYNIKGVDIELQPYVAYRLSGRFRPGIGASYRLNVNSGVSYAGVYGLRAFNDFRLLGTMYFRLEGEWIHFSDAALLRYALPSERNPTTCKLRLNAGITKTYTISNRLDGSAQILYNVADMTRFPSGSNTSIRFGVEYKIKALKK